MFCCETETVNHLFFECAVARQMWSELSQVFDIHIGCSLDEIGKFWLSNKRNCVLNMVIGAALWSLWKLRNDICCQRNGWRGCFPDTKVGAALPRREEGGVDDQDSEYQVEIEDGALAPRRLMLVLADGG